MKSLAHLFPTAAPPSSTHAMQVRVDKDLYDLLYPAFPWRGGISTITSILFSKFVSELKIQQLSPVPDHVNRALIINTILRLNFKPQGPRVE